MDSWGVFTLFYKVHSPIPSDSGEGKVPTIGNSSDRGPAGQLSASLDIREPFPYKSAAEGGGWRGGGWGGEVCLQWAGLILLMSILALDGRGGVGELG